MPATGCPASATGRALSIADRADTLAGVFALGKRPSGAKDPFGLRRTALGLLRILVEDQVDLDLPALLDEAVRLQPVQIKDATALAAELFDFIMDRVARLVPGRSGTRAGGGRDHG